MTVRREKKSKYFRGSRTCGWGRVAQHRRSGRKGGRGRVGYHKHKWSWVVKYAKEWYGKRGFTRHPSLVKHTRLINVGELDELVEELIRLGVARVEGDSIHVNIMALGYNKLGGKGKVSKKLVVEGLEATGKAIHKLEEAGGTFVAVKGGRS